MFKSPKEEEKMKKCFSEKVELKVDMEGYIMEIRHMGFAFSERSPILYKTCRCQNWEIWSL